MAVLQVNDSSVRQLVPRKTLPHGASREDELDQMLADLSALVDEMPDVIIRSCMAIMARCTEMHVEIIRGEAQDRRAKFFRTSQLAKVMELADFMFKGASRLVEVARQEIDLSR